MSGMRIGGNVGDIQDTALVMTDTGTYAQTTGQDATTVAGQMEAEVNDVTQTLNTHFVELAEGLRQQITAAKNRLAGTDWEGMSQSEATAAEAELNGQVTSVLEQAQAGVEEFRTAMLSQANNFVSAIQGEFNTVMANINESYGSLSTASTTFAQNLEAADQTIKRA